MKSKQKAPRAPVQRVNVDFPIEMLSEIDQEVERLGINRQAWIKMRLRDVLVATAKGGPRG